jgi:hypothetical protein
LKAYDITCRPGRRGALLALAARLPAPILAERVGIHPSRAAEWVRAAGAIYADLPRGTKVLRTEPLKAMVIGALVRGVSMRDVESLCEQAGLGTLSKSTADRLEARPPLLRFPGLAEFVVDARLEPPDDQSAPHRGAPPVRRQTHDTPAPRRTRPLARLRTRAARARRGYGLSAARNPDGW